MAVCIEASGKRTLKWVGENFSKAGVCFGRKLATSTSHNQLHMPFKVYPFRIASSPTSTFVFSSRRFSTVQAHASGYRMLCIDGGGVRGIIPGMVMDFMSQFTGKPLHHLFDGIAGTSTGGILGLSACAPLNPGGNQNRFSSKEILSLYTDPEMSRRIFLPVPSENVDSPGKKPRITIISFNFGSTPFIDTELPGMRKWVRTQYSASNLEMILKERFGELRLKDMLTDVLITSLDIKTRVPKIFTRSQAVLDPLENHLVWQVARITSAAPTYFNPFLLNRMCLVDGGMVANNPTLCMILEVQKRNIPMDKIVCVSLGTGNHKPPLDTHDFGLLQFIPHVYPVMSQSASSLVHQQSKALLKSNYYRIQAKLPRDIPLDTTSHNTIGELIEIGAKLIERKKDKIQRVCDRLLEIGRKNNL